MSPVRPPAVRLVVGVLLALAVLGGLGVWTNAFGVGDRAASLARRIELAIDPPPDRPIADVEVTPRPVRTPDPEGSASPAETSVPGATPAQGATPAPSASGAATPEPTVAPPPRVAVDVNLYRHPDRRFISQLDEDWCAVAGTQMVIAAHGRGDLSAGFQEEIAARIGEWESRRDSRNGGWGPSAIVSALEAYGVHGYEVRTYRTRADALRDAARAIADLRAPVVLLSWRGAHTWVMTGYRADADPRRFEDARVSGAYVLDPWFPRVSSIWGPSDPPGTFQDAAEMRRNYLPWQRPEGSYPTRDGLFVAVVPTLPLEP